MGIRRVGLAFILPAAQALKASWHDPGPPVALRYNEDHIPRAFKDTQEQLHKSLINADGRGVAIFVSLGNTSIWSDLKPCVENVGAVVEEMKTIPQADLYMGYSVPRQFQVDEAKKIPGIREVNVQVVADKGADQGWFIQQLLGQRHMRPGSNDTSGWVTSGYQFVLKLHSKTDDYWRNLTLTELCGSPQQVRQNLGHMLMDRTVGMIGPAGLTLSPATPRAQVRHESLMDSAFREEEMAAVRSTWPMLFPDWNLPPKPYWRLIWGGMYWARARPVMAMEELYTAAPALVNSMGGLYKRGSCCTAVHAMERILPTAFQAAGFQVVPT